MFPGLGGGLNPKKMQGMMKQLGIAQEEIPTQRVIIEKLDGARIIIENPDVTKIKMQGQEMIQVAGGESREETSEVGVSEDDIKTIVEKTGSTEAQARESLEKTKDLAESILELS
ncbi:nascent polypeptide-associated complex protein [Candidatus Pacearchaeota archaeon]|nr:nascent polypeptide-associated complex protein [Candidatus Pacearchaeota archaeon]